MHIAPTTVVSLNNYPFFLPFSSLPTLAEETVLKQKCLLTTELWGTGSFSPVTGIFSVLQLSVLESISVGMFKFRSLSLLVSKKAHPNLTSTQWKTFSVQLERFNYTTYLPEWGHLVFTFYNCIWVVYSETRQLFFPVVSSNSWLHLVVIIVHNPSITRLSW